MGILKYTLSKGAKAPLKASTGAAGYDCYALKKEFLTTKNNGLFLIKPSQAKPNDLIRYWTGVSIEIPEGYVGLTFARSSIIKTPLIMANTTGIIDSDYRGEILFTFRILESQYIEEMSYQIGDRVGQLVLLKSPHFSLKQVDELSNSDRGAGAYGSTGR